MSLLTALALDPFLVNQTLLESLLLEPDAIEVFIYEMAGSPGGGSAIAAPSAIAYSFWQVTRQLVTRNQAELRLSPLTCQAFNSIGIGIAKWRYGINAQNVRRRPTLNANRVKGE